MTKLHFPGLTVLLIMCLFCATGNADITDFNNWTLVEDPADPSFSGTVNSASQVTLTANGGPVPAGTDIGFSSVNGPTPLGSTQGYYFDTGSDFSIAVDYSMTFNSAVGILAFGFGIGEDSAGANSAGVTLVTGNGSPAQFGYASRVGDASDEFGTLGIGPAAAARMLASYTASNGNITVGVSNDGDDIAEASFTFSGVQDKWTDGQLLASFFIRSDDMFGPAWQGGLSNTSVTNFRVLSGSATAVPEPGSAVFVTGLALFGLTRRRR